MPEISGVLDLTGADTSGFEPLPAAAYAATVFDAEWRETKGGEGSALPEATPYLNVQFKIDDVEVKQDDGKLITAKNRRAFSKYFPIVPEGYDADKAAKNKGNFVKFLTAVGYDEKKVTGGKFALDIEDLKTRACVVILSRKEYPPNSGEYQNEVKGVKAVGSGTGAARTGVI